MDRTRGIVQDYQARLQAWRYSADLTDKCIRTILHLIVWLSASETGTETLDISVLHRFLNRGCACPGPHGYRKNLERARWHLQADPTDKLETLHRWHTPSLRKGKFKGVQDE